MSWSLARLFENGANTPGAQNLSSRCPIRRIVRMRIRQKDGQNRPYICSMCTRLPVDIDIQDSLSISSFWGERFRMLRWIYIEPIRSWGEQPQVSNDKFMWLKERSMARNKRKKNKLRSLNKYVKAILSDPATLRFIIRVILTLIEWFNKQ